MDVYARCLHPYVNREGVAYGCGQCTNCRKAKSLEWAIRARHELIEEPKAFYATFTYNKEHLNVTAIKAENEYDQRGTLEEKDMQGFLKRIRKAYPEKRLRYLYSGEYGPRKWRPHYHMIMWGLDYTEITKKELMELWGKGNVDLSKEFVTDWAIGYVVGYIKKKIIDQKIAKEKYTDNNRKPPYHRTSQGLGKKWSDKNENNWCETLTVSYNGKQFPIPRYYIKRVKKKEGIVVKYDHIKIKITGLEVSSNNYKVIADYNGINTRKIEEKQKEIKEQKRTEWNRKYRIENTEEIKEKEKEIEEKREIERIIEYEEVKGQNEKERKKKYRRIKDERKEKKKGTIDNDPIVPKEISDKLNSIARRKAYEYYNGLYGKRDGIEIAEDWQSTEDEASGLDPEGKKK